MARFVIFHTEPNREDMAVDRLVVGCSAITDQPPTRDGAAETEGAAPVAV